MLRVLVTGAGGFVGRALVERLARERDYEVVAAVRKRVPPVSGIELVRIDDIDKDTDWSTALEGVSIIVHAAGRAHVLADEAADPLTEFRRVNVDGTVNLARSAAAAGVCRFVFISSIGVNGSATERPFTEYDTPAPSEPYAVSKYEAEQSLHELGRATGMEIVIIRPPLVYGRGAPGNVQRMVRAIERGIPLPFGKIDNRRTLIALPNLVDLIITCMGHPAATNETFLAGDGEDLSTGDLLRRLGKAQGKHVILLPVPAVLLKMVLCIVGRCADARRLTASLQVDIGKARTVLGWSPPWSVNDAIAEMAAEKPA